MRTSWAAGDKEGRSSSDRGQALDTRLLSLGNMTCEATIGDQNGVVIDDLLRQKNGAELRFKAW